MSEKDYRGLMLRSAIEQGEEQFTTIMDCLDRAKRDIQGYADHYKSVQPGDRCKQEEILSWVANSLMGIMSNLRVDMLVSTAARIAEARGRVDINS